MFPYLHLHEDVIAFEQIRPRRRTDFAFHRIFLLLPSSSGVVKGNIPDGIDNPDGIDKLAGKQVFSGAKVSEKYAKGMAEWRILQLNSLFSGIDIAFPVHDMVRKEQKPAEPLPQPFENMNQSSLGLRPYLEILVELCQSLDRDGLQHCILALAKQVQPADRQVFLQNFRTLLPENEHQAVAVAHVEESFLMSEVESLRQEIENRLKSLEKISWDDSGDDDRRQSNSNADRKMLH